LSVMMIKAIGFPSQRTDWTLDRFHRDWKSVAFVWGQRLLLAWRVPRNPAADQP
jgi:hypothetical protein